MKRGQDDHDVLLEPGEQGGIQAIPPTLQQSLMARLPLRDVAGMENAALHAALERLADADIVLVEGLPPESEYRFKHALIQDAAYANRLKSSRA